MKRYHTYLIPLTYDLNDAEAFSYGASFCAVEQRAIVLWKAEAHQDVGGTDGPSWKSD